MIKLRLLSFSCNTEIILLRKDKSADAGVSAQYTGMGSTHGAGSALATASCVRPPTSFDLHRHVCPGPHTSIIVGALFSRPLPARVLHQVALQLCRARTAMSVSPSAQT
jgi:hypothetical protein